MLLKSKSRLLVKIVACVIIQAYLMIDLSWAANMSIKSSQKDCLSPSLKIVNTLIQSSFRKIVSSGAINLKELKPVTPVELNHTKAFLKGRFEKLFEHEEEVMQNIDFLVNQLTVRKKKLIHINATSDGGGVAEILHQLLPFYKDLGLDVEWYTLETLEKYDYFDSNGNKINKFHDVTKKVHNAAQGKWVTFTKEEVEIYNETLKYNATRLKNVLQDPDNIFFIEDFQPAGLIPEIRKINSKANILFRLHIDTYGLKKYKRTRKQLKFVVDPIKQADAIVTHTKGFALDYLRDEFDGNKKGPVQITMRPAINFFNDKNIDFIEKFGSKEEAAKAEAMVADRIVDIDGNKFNPDRPFMLLLSRFDPWKGHVHTIKGFKKLHQKITAHYYDLLDQIENYEQDESEKDVDLWLVGNFATDDPEGLRFYEKIKKRAEKNPKIHIATFKKEENDLNVNYMQRKAKAVIQLSTREGFGLTVAEALFKGVPVLGSAIGGIVEQIINGFNGFLLNIEDYYSRSKVMRLIEKVFPWLVLRKYIGAIAERMYEILHFPDTQRALIAANARVSIIEKFSLTSLVLHRLVLALDGFDNVDRNRTVPVSEFSQEVLARFKKTPILELVFERGAALKDQMFMQKLKDYLKEASASSKFSLDLALNFINIYVVRRNVGHKILYEPLICRAGCVTANGKIYIDENMWNRAKENVERVQDKFFEQIMGYIKQIIDKTNNGKHNLRLKNDPRVSPMIDFIEAEKDARPVFSEDKRIKYRLRYVISPISQSI